jgi:hypothetical protein
MRTIECLFAGFLLLFGPVHFASGAAPAGTDHPKIDFPKTLEDYQDDQVAHLQDNRF